MTQAVESVVDLIELGAIAPEDIVKCLRSALMEPRQWQGLTADEIWKCNAAPSGSSVEYHICMAHQNVLDFAEAIEAKLREKNNG